MMHRSKLSAVVLAAWAIALTVSGSMCAQTDGSAQVSAQVSAQGLAPTPWSNATIDAFATLPTQENGRVKPLDTVLQFKLYRVHQKRSLRVPDEPRFGEFRGEVMTPSEWGLAVLFHPRWAQHLPSFTITDSVTLEAIGLADEVKRKRDRYSFATLRPATTTLQSMVQPIHNISEKNRDLLQKQIVALYRGVVDYSGLERAFDFAGHRYEVPEADRDLFAGRDEARTSEVLAALPKLFERYQGTQPTVQARQIFADVEFYCSNNWGLTWIAPVEESVEQWLSVRDVYELAILGALPEPYVESLAKAERVADAIESGDAAELEKAAIAFQEFGKARAMARGEYGQIELEVSNYRADYYMTALVGFLAAFLALCGSWFFGRNRVLPILSFSLSTFAWISLTTGIVVRCIVRSRPPVTGLYDTILFISAVLVLVALLTELIHRKRIGLLTASVLGAVGMYLSFNFELTSGKDTMDPLIAVLDTNFWLSTHVTTVTMGYAAGMLAAGLAWVFLLGKAFGVKRAEPGYYHTLGKMLYGTIAFGVVFSTVGTILGGVWANDSWGRFWGWDPKENGALMIVLWFLIILHCRMGGYIRNWGMALMSVIGGMVVAFSWWGVNLLGVGLHSYGFTAGIDSTLNIFYGSSLVVFTIGAVARQFLNEGSKTPGAARSTASAAAAAGE